MRTLTEIIKDGDWCISRTGLSYLISIEDWEILKAAVLAQQTNNSAMVPYECVHGISINEDCAVCKEYMGVDRRVIVQHQ